MLLQLQHMLKCRKRRFIAELDFSDHLDQDQFANQYCERVIPIMERHPLPKGAEWWAVTETSDCFLRGKDRL